MSSLLFSQSVFRYDVTACETKVIPANPFTVIANVLRFYVISAQVVFYWSYTIPVLSMSVGMATTFYSDVHHLILYHVGLLVLNMCLLLVLNFQLKKEFPTVITKSFRRTVGCLFCIKKSI
jgi:hypothetical protein